MLFAAIVVGLITTYYLGVRAGGVAAAAAAALFVIASFYPPLKLVAYALVGIGLAGVCIVGPHYQRPETKKQARDVLKWLKRAFAYGKRKL